MTVPGEALIEEERAIGKESTGILLVREAYCQELQALQLSRGRMVHYSQHVSQHTYMAAAPVSQIPAIVERLTATPGLHNASSAWYHTATQQPTAAPIPGNHMAERIRNAGWWSVQRGQGSRVLRGKYIATS